MSRSRGKAPEACACGAATYGRGEAPTLKATRVLRVTIARKYTENTKTWQELVRDIPGRIMMWARETYSGDPKGHIASVCKFFKDGHKESDERLRVSCASRMQE